MGSIEAQCVPHPHICNNTYEPQSLVCANLEHINHEWNEVVEGIMIQTTDTVSKMEKGCQEMALWNKLYILAEIPLSETYNGSGELV